MSTMWKDRLSGRSTPSGVPPRYRSQSPAPRASSSHLAPSLPSFQRPNLSPRSSSLSLISNPSTSSLPLPTHLSNGSALRHSSGDGPAIDVPNPLGILEKILGEPVEDSGKRLSDSSTWKERSQTKGLEVPGIADFGDLSLAAFAEGQRWEGAKTKDSRMDEFTSIEECM